MDYKNKTKLSVIDKQKIRNRYESKLLEFQSKSLDELQDIFQSTKMSSTDRHAIIKAADIKLKERALEIAKERELEDNIDAE